MNYTQTLSSLLTLHSPNSLWPAFLFVEIDSGRDVDSLLKAERLFVNPVL